MNDLTLCLLYNHYDTGASSTPIIMILGHLPTPNITHSTGMLVTMNHVSYASDTCLYVRAKTTVPFLTMLPQNSLL